MKIGVISDTHGSLSAWLSAYRYFADTDFIVHCGDVLYHGPRNPLPEGYDPGELAKTINTVERPILIARGNCDADVDQMLLEYPLESPYVHIMTEDRRIFVHHGHHSPLENFPLKNFSSHSIIISGHTHLPGIELKNDSIFLNPGSPSLPKNPEKTPTIAIIEERSIEIINISTGEIFQKTMIA